jgi:hypothetical protein
MNMEHWWKDTDGGITAYWLLFIRISIFESNSVQKSQQATSAEFWELANEGW